jgi:hypothetical protein
MATTEQGALLTEAHRRLQARLRGVTAAEVAAIMPMIEFSNITGTWPAVEAAMVRLIERNRRLSSKLSLDYYRNFRVAEGITGRFSPIPASPVEVDKLVRNLRITGPGRAGELFRTNRIDIADRTFASLEGEVSRNVLNGGRDAIVNTIQADKKCIGWSRVTDGNPCGFCAMLASRGPVYKAKGDALAGPAFSERVNDFRAHAHCACTAEPVYSTDTEWPGRSKEFQDTWYSSDPDFDRFPDDTRERAFRREMDRQRREAGRLTVGT